MSVDHLIALGHRRIAAIRGVNIGDWADERYLAYTNTLAKAGIEFDGNLVANLEHWEPTSIHSVVVDMLRLARKDPPTAIVCPDDYLALATINSVKQAGHRVPEDISIVGFDDVPEAETSSPPLTTIRQPMRAIGKLAVHKLLSAINRTGEARLRSLLPPELIVRESTAPVK